MGSERAVSPLTAGVFVLALQLGKVAWMNRHTLLAVVLVAGMSSTGRSADSFKVDGGHSAVIFRVEHLGVSYTYGRFNAISGKFVFSDDKPEAAMVEIEVQSGSVDTGDAKRDQHLKGPDFFSAKQFPILSFKSRKVTLAGAGIYEVEGDLSVRGVVKPLKVTLARVGTGKDPWGGVRTGFETSFVVKRSEFGMTYMIPGIGDDVRMTVSIEGIKE